MKPLLVFALFFCFCAGLGAWDRKRHVEIRQSAYGRLSAPTRALLAPFLVRADTLETGINVDAIRYRGPARCTAGWHYVNLNGRDYLSGPPAKRGDAVRALFMLEDYLRSYLSRPKENPEETRLALALWVHIVADVHQPLHTGYRCDRGGNGRRIIVGKRRLRLHAFWDGGLPARAGGLKRTSGQVAAAVSNNRDYVQWVEATHQFVPQAYACAAPKSNGQNDGNRKTFGCGPCPLQTGDVLASDQYVQANGALLVRQMQLAAARTAAGLEAIAGGQSLSSSEQQRRAQLRPLRGAANLSRCLRGAARGISK